ncbi:TIGR02253 family HAD-type hydrolase [Thermococcus waiotapuensis]|uniref:Glyceraldehyde 3-phosphate phosphatase n=1 Tax=Thermococcus waiotapuensis TaxID=90909 RepID=A0AAE4NTY6_9EURY|nr:TIGR02253 family HAD-type hydrolase [Thermococcus waiotapuensis]MDV3103257.1 TIGR02253 family HAD-type hydrolase [Thermococcus waiotapuensis]
MVQALLFDVDYTLLTEMPLIQLFLPQVYGKLAKKLGVNKEEARNRFLSEIFSRKDTYEWHDWNFFFRLFDLDMKYEELIERYPHRITVYPDVPPVLEWLKEEGYLLGVVTSGPEYQKVKLKITGLDRYFDVVVIREDVGEIKPSPKIFLYALETLEVNPENAVMVGDSLWQDVYGGKNVGMKTAWINRSGNDSDYHFADFRIKTFYELRKIVGVLP